MNDAMAVIGDHPLHQRQAKKLKQHNKSLVGFFVQTFTFIVRTVSSIFYTSRESISNSDEISTHIESDGTTTEIAATSHPLIADTTESATRNANVIMGNANAISVSNPPFLGNCVAGITQSSKEQDFRYRVRFSVEHPNVCVHDFSLINGSVLHFF